MAEGAFTIVELFRVGGATSPQTGERFEWTADPTPPDPLKGGARAAPMQPWTFARELRTVRTDYPGAKTPSEQVLGPRYAPFTLNGNFRDKYNFAGYAVREQQRLEALVGRGNICRFSYQDVVFEGLITNISFDYRRAFDIGYEFTVSNHGRPGDIDLANRSPASVLSARDLSQGMTAAIRIAGLVLDSADVARGQYQTGAVSDARASLADIEAAADAATATIEQREIETELKPVDSFRRAATQFRAVQQRAADAVLDLIELRADLEMATESAVAILDFEQWTRSLRFYYRILIGQSGLSAAQLDERAEPSALRFHRAAEGETLYNISNHYYGTPHAWRFIADRNGLTDVTLTGDELLIIPERGAG